MPFIRLGHIGRAFGIAVAAFVFVAFAGPIPAATAASLVVTRVDDPVPDGCHSGVDCSLREAVIAANSHPGDDNIQLSATTYTLTGFERPLLDVTDTTGELFVLGAGAGATTITKDQFAVGFFRVGSGAELHLHGLSVVGTGPEGEFSVGVWNEGGDVSVVDSVLTDHVSVRGGGVWNDSGNAFITNTTIDRGVGGIAGGAVYNGSDFVFITDSTLSGGLAAEGGGLYNDRGTAIVTGGAILGNEGFDVGGGGIYNNAGTVTVDGTTIVDNNVQFFGSVGGGIYNTGVLSLRGATVSGNHAEIASGIYNSGSLEMEAGTAVTGNVSRGAIGAILNEGVAMLDLVEISGNLSGTQQDGGYGGGIFNIGSMEVTDTVLAGNEVMRGTGGGIANFGELTIAGSTVSDNLAAFAGGILDGGSLTLLNSTISGHSVAGFGGGLWLADGSDAELAHVTITGNDAFQGGGIYSETLDATLTGTILADNSESGFGGPDCWGSLASGGYNLLGSDEDCAFVGAGPTDLVGSASAPIDPLLAPLADNGGPTRTHALRPGSPAAGAIPVAACTVPDDQRGVARPQGGACDLGSFEAEVDTTPPEATAALLPAGKVGRNDGTFEVDFSCFDSVDPSPTVTALLNGVPVADGQIVKLKHNKLFQVKTIKGGQLFLLGPEFVLQVTCVDASGNRATAVAEHVFGS